MGNPTVSFDELAAAVNEILGSRDYQRVDDEAPWCWEHGRSRVHLWAPPEANPQFPYIISRRRYEDGADGKRWLNPGTNEVFGEAGASAERLAGMIEAALQNPY
jgi:hypothetical protein